MHGREYDIRKSRRVSKAETLRLLEEWRGELAHRPESVAAAKRRRRIEKYLDSGEHSADTGTPILFERPGGRR